MILTSEQIDRASGVLLGQAIGDALGVPYEFAAPVAAGQARMVGGGLGPYEPGEYSDDTQMAVCIARIGVTGTDLSSESGIDAVARAFVEWYRDGASDVGIGTRAALSSTPRPGETPGRQLARAAEEYHISHGMGAGNGALMRTAIVALGSLDDRDRTARAAAAIAGLTHADRLAAESSVLLTEAVRIAVVEGRLDLRAGLDLLIEPSRQEWSDWIDAAEHEVPGTFTPNGYTVTTMQAAWSAIIATGGGSVGPDGPGARIEAGLQRAVAIGDDTDTVGAVVGALLGARWGASALPAAWVDAVHGWPGLRAADLVDLAQRTAGV